MHTRCKANKEREKVDVVGRRRRESERTPWMRGGDGGVRDPRQVTSGKLARRATKEKRAKGLKYTRENAEFMCSHTWLVLTCEIVS